MPAIEMESTQQNGTTCNLNTKTSLIPWCFESNWLVAHGSLEASVAVDSSDYPIDESELEIPARKSPLVLSPRVSDSGPCEIKICFAQKYDISQIYVRSTARVYEVYYAHSRNSSNEYLCTVRCGVAERDEKLLQTNWTGDVAEEHSVLEELTEETVTDGASTFASEDDWVRVTNGMKTVQDLYEATAQINDADPCSSLTVRLLSLQDKGQVYVDDIYIYVDPVESSDPVNEAVLAGSSTQSSLMAMFVPTLLQLSKSGGSRVQDKIASDEVVKGDKTEAGSKRIDRIDVQLGINKICQQNVKPLKLDNDTAESGEIRQHTSAEKCFEPVKDLPPGHLETALEQLISRVSRMEDFFLRFEEKMLKPIERIDARLQKVEDQLEKLAKDSQNFGLPHCTRISAPAFSCSESNSSSFYNEQSDHPPCGVSELEKKDTPSNSMPKLCHDANFHPSLVVSAPEFSCGEDEDDNDVLVPIKDSSCIKPKKSLSVDDALAAALNGFLASAIIHPSEPNQTSSSLFSEVHEQIQYQEHADSCQIEAPELPAVENDNRDSLRLTQVLTVKAPDFIADENSDVEHLNYIQPTLDMACVNEEMDHGDETDPRSIQSTSLFTSADSCHSDKNEGTSDFRSASDGYFPAASLQESDTGLVNGQPATQQETAKKEMDKKSSLLFKEMPCKEVRRFTPDCFFFPRMIYPQNGSFHNPLIKRLRGPLLNGSFEVNTIESYFGGDTSNDSTPDVAKNSIETSRHQIYDEANPGKTTSFNPDDDDIASKQQVLGHESESVSELIENYLAVQSKSESVSELTSDSCGASLLDFELPILEVKFTRDVHTSTKAPLEALLDGAAETEAPSIHDSGDDDVNTDHITAVVMDGNEMTDPLPFEHLLVDLGVCAADGSSNLESESHNLFTPSSLELNASLI